MEINYSFYDYKKSIDRIDEILSGSDASYEEHNGIPSRDKLTYDNGFNVAVTVLYVDIRKSKELSSKHTKPVLAKIYRSYISEVVAVLKGNVYINEVYIEGDGIWAVFNTTKKSEVDSVFNTAYTISSLVDILNIKLSRKGYTKLTVGIGVDDADSLYIKAGYKGSGINEVVWIGKVVGQTSVLCSYGNQTFADNEIMVSELVYSSLSDHNKGLLIWNTLRQCYHGDVINIELHKWVTNNE